jgi:hypothetical protein
MFASISSVRSYDTHWVWDCYSRLLADSAAPQTSRVTGETPGAAG